MRRHSRPSWRAFGSSEAARAPAAAGQAVQALPGQICRVLGLDPGSHRTGFGLIDCDAQGERHVTNGCINVAGHEMVVRLARIFDGIRALIERYRPDSVAIERVFVHRNADSALKLGQARGVALCAAAQLGASVHEYAPRAIKLAVTGYGAAAKPQVAQMVGSLLRLEATPAADAADALAVALCHAHARRLGALQGLRAAG